MLNALICNENREVSKGDNVRPICISLGENGRYINRFSSGRIDYETRERDLATEGDTSHATNILEEVVLAAESVNLKHAEKLAT